MFIIVPLSSKQINDYYNIVSWFLWSKDPVYVSTLKYRAKMRRERLISPLRDCGGGVKNISIHQQALQAKIILRFINSETSYSGLFDFYFSRYMAEHELFLQPIFFNIFPNDMPLSMSFSSFFSTIKSNHHFNICRQKLV